LAYLSHGVQVFFPHVKSLDELHDILEETQTDYLVYDKVASALRPELKMLSGPIDTVAWLTPVYFAPQGSLIIYKVDISPPSQDGNLAPEPHSADFYRGISAK
jgi:hypothetical protein